MIEIIKDLKYLSFVQTDSIIDIRLKEVQISQISIKLLIHLLTSLQVTHLILTNYLSIYFVLENLLHRQFLAILLLSLTIRHLYSKAFFYRLLRVPLTMQLLQIYHRSFLNLSDICLITVHRFRNLKLLKNQIVSFLDLMLNS